MRITAGKFKNTALKAPKGDLTRPTSAKVREAVMSMLLPWIPEARIMDCFAGSGGFGLEALSRGAARVCFLEKNSKALEAIKHNVSKCGLSSVDAKVLKIDLFCISDRIAEEFRKSDIVWADPPYDIVKDWVTYFIDHENLHPPPESCLVIECASADCGFVVDTLEGSKHFAVEKTKKYGDTSIVFALREEDNESTV